MQHAADKYNEDTHTVTDPDFARVSCLLDKISYDDDNNNGIKAKNSYLLFMPINTAMPRITIKITTPMAIPVAIPGSINMIFQ